MCIRVSRKEVPISIYVPNQKNTKCPIMINTLWFSKAQFGKVVVVRCVLQMFL